MSRRINIDLTDAAEAEVNRIISITGLESSADVFRSALTLLRIHVDAVSRGSTICEHGVFGGKSVISLPFMEGGDAE